MGTPKKVIGWEGEIKGNLTYPVRVVYSYVTRTAARLKERQGDEENLQIEYRITLDPAEDRELKKAIMVHAECEMEEYAQLITVVQGSKPPKSKLMKIIKK